MHSSSKEKLKKIVNPNNFRFIVILYNNSNDIKIIKEYLKAQYNENEHLTLDLNSKTYTDLASLIYGVDKGFIYIDSLDEMLGNNNLYSGFNQRRDKIASYAINLITFYPKSAESKLYKKAVSVIPDLWEFRSPIVRLETSTQSERSSHENINESSSYSSLGGLTSKEKMKEIERLKEKLKNSTLEELKLNILNQLTQLFNEVGEYQEGISFAKRALTIATENFAKKSKERATTLTNLAELYWSNKEYTKSLPLYEEALEIRKEVLGEKNSETAESYNNLGGVYDSLEEYDKAIEFQNKALKIRIVTLGENHPDTAVIYNNIGLAYGNKGEYDKAIEFYNKALKIWFTTVGENHHDTAICYNNIGGVWDNKGEYTKAIDFYNKALKILIDILGKNHPNVKVVKGNLETAKKEK